MAGDHAETFAVLGPHATPGAWMLRALLPGAIGVLAVDKANGRPIASLARTEGSALVDGRHHELRGDLRLAP